MPQDLEEGRTETIQVTMSHASLAILIMVVENGNCSLKYLTRGTVADIMPATPPDQRWDALTYEQPTEIEGLTST